MCRIASSQSYAKEVSNSRSNFTDEVIQASEAGPSQHPVEGVSPEREDSNANVQASEDNIGPGETAAEEMSSPPGSKTDSEHDTVVDTNSQDGEGETVANKNTSDQLSNQVFQYDEYNQRTSYSSYHGATFTESVATGKKDAWPF